MADEKEITDINGAGDKNNASQKVISYTQLKKMGCAKLSEMVYEHGEVFVSSVKFRPLKIVPAKLG